MKSKRLVFFGLAWTGMILYFTQRWIYGPLIPSLMQEFGVNKTVLGVVGSASLWGYLFTAIGAGLLSDRYGRKYIVLIGIFGFSLFTAICGSLTSVNQLFAARFLTGISEAMFFVPLIAFTMELFPERPGFYVTLMSSGSSLGWFTGPALAGWLLGLTGNWRMPFFVTGIIGIAVAILLFIFWPRQTQQIRTRISFDRSILKPMNLLMLLILSISATFQIAAEFGFTMWYPVFLKTEMGLAITLSGLVSGAYGVGQFIGRPTFGWLSDKYGYRTIGITGGIITGLLLMVVLSVHGPFPGALLTFFTGFTGAAMMGAIWTFTGITFPANKGLALGLVVTFAYVVASLAPITIGYLGDHYSVGFGLWSVCVPSFFLAAAVFLATNFVKLPERK